LNAIALCPCGFPHVALGWCRWCLPKRFIRLATRTFANGHDQRCRADGCDHKAWVKGFCQSHYYRDYSHRKENAPSDTHYGVVKTGVRGWGSLL
jgi:hypothetical protein